MTAINTSDKRKVLFDLTGSQPSADAVHHGGAEYTKALFWRIIEIKYSFSCVYNPSKKLDAEIAESCRVKNIKLIPAENNRQLKEVILTGNYDVFYSSMPYGYYDLEFGKTLFCFTIHGLREIEIVTDLYILHYLSFSFRNLVKHNLLKNSFWQKQRIKRYKLLLQRLVYGSNKRIFTVSEHTKFALLDVCPKLDANSVGVFYSPVYNPDTFFSENDEASFLASKKIEAKKYFLLVSSNRWIKNSLRALKAIDGLIDKHQLGMKVLITGASENRIIKLKNPDHFVFTDYLDYKELDIAFRNAFAFIFPSLNEGFGYPPLQAMKYGTPVLASSITSIPEVCGNAALYFNPYSVDEIRNRILNIMNNPVRYQELSIRGPERFRSISEKQSMMLSEMIEIIFTDNRNT